MFSAGSEVAVVVFGLSASGEILTDVVVETVQLLPLAESDFVLSLGQVTSTTAEVSVTGTPGSSFYIGLFTTEAISSIDKNDLADVIISTFGENMLKSVYTLPEDQDTGRISFSGLSASTSFTFVLFGFDKEKLEVVSATQTQTFTTPAGGDTPVNPGNYAFGTITLSNPTNSSVDMEIVPADATKPYTIMVEYADYVDQFASDAQLFSEDLAFYYDYMSSQNITGMTVYQLFDQNDLLYTGSVKGSYGELEPGTRYCAYAYYMNAEETLDGDIAKAYFTTTGTAAASVKAVRSVRRNYVERPFQVPAVLGAAASCNAVLAPLSARYAKPNSGNENEGCPSGRPFFVTPGDTGVPACHPEPAEGARRSYGHELVRVAMVNAPSSRDVSTSGLVAPSLNMTDTEQSCIVNCAL